MDNTTTTTSSEGWISKFQLPNAAKRIGIAIAVISFLSLFLNKFSLDSELWRVIARYGMIIGALIISLSKEKIEDEFIIKLRMQSYMIAFLLGVAYIIILPFLNQFADLLFDMGTGDFKEMGDFMVLWLLLSLQVLIFESLKRKNA